ncbi:MAG: anti-sigma factor antagonist [Phycisphaerales bacterium]|jgi:anti-anti-sigma factor|nr:anti-sigma factor antagonist [Phycisphaerales bacterium]
MAIEDWSDRVIIAHLSGEPQFSDDLQSIADRIGSSQQQQSHSPQQQSMDVVLNFAGLRFVTSSQIAQLLKLRKDLASGGTRLLLCGVDAQVWGSFLVTGIDKAFEFSDAVPTALATLQLSRA